MHNMILVPNLNYHYQNKVPPRDPGAKGAVNRMNHCDKPKQICRSVGFQLKVEA